MTSISFRVLALTIAAVACLGPLAGAQVVRRGNPYYRTAMTVASPYWGYSWDPYGSALHGLAAVIQAEGDSLIKVQVAAKLREEVRREKLKTHKEVLEHWEWVRDFQSKSFNRKEERNQRADLDRSLSTALSSGEIFYAGPQNRLFKEMKKLSELPAAGSTPIDEDVLPNINFTVTGCGNAGLLKKKTLPWPMLLRQPAFKPYCDEISHNLSRAKELVLTDQRESDELTQVISKMEHQLDDLAKLLRQQLRIRSDDPDWSYSYYKNASSFIGQVKGAVSILGKPDMEFYLIPLQGKTVAELVKYMKKKGIEFAPATEGTERYYKILLDHLANEMTRLQPNLSTRP